MKRAILTCLWVLLVTIVCSAQTTFYFPHIANGVQAAYVWKTTILLTNAAPAGGAAASGTITFLKDNQLNLSAAGSPFTTIEFVDQSGAPAGNGGTITFSIPPGETRKYTSTGSGDYSGGFATVMTTAGTVTGTSIFSEFNLAGRLLAEAGVPSASALANQAVFADTQDGFNVGVAYSNVGAAAATVSLGLISSAAATVASTTQTLGAGNHNAIFLSELFGSVPAMTGRLEIKATGSTLSTIALRFDRDFAVFTTLPPITLASLMAPAVRWLENRPYLAPLSSVARLLGSFQFRLG